MEAKNLSWGSGATTALVALPILYILSIGPVAYTMEKSGVRLSPEMNTALGVVYMPIGALAQYTPLEKPLMKYVQWWTDLGKAP